MLIWISACEGETHDGPTQQILMQVVSLLMQRLSVLLIILCNLLISTYIINKHKANVYFRDRIHAKKTQTFLFGCVQTSHLLQELRRLHLKRLSSQDLFFS